MLRRMFLSTAALIFTSNISASTGKEFILDTVHTKVGFTVPHLVVSEVEGQFKVFKGSGTGTFSKDEATIDSLHIEIDVASIDTNEPKRDKHLRSDQIFNVEKFKTMTFVSTKVEYENKKPTKIHGNLTLHGVTKPVTFNVTWGGYIVDAWKNEKIAFKAETQINRTEYGVKWNKTLETGGVLVGEDVKILVRVEADREAPKMIEAPKAKDTKATTPAKK